MAVYVDDFEIPYRRMKMCHMIADTDEELHAMAADIGVARKWWQSPDNHSGSHYDICLQMKDKALAYGAIAITSRQAAAMNARRRVEGGLGSPDEALTWYSTYRQVIRDRRN